MSLEITIDPSKELAGRRINISATGEHSAVSRARRALCLAAAEIDEQTVACVEVDVTGGEMIVDFSSAAVLSRALPTVEEIVREANARPALLAILGDALRDAAAQGYTGATGCACEVPECWHREARAAVEAGEPETVPARRIARYFTPAARD